LPLKLKKEAAAQYRKGYRMLKPDDGKLSRPVLRREGESNLPDLSDMDYQNILKLLKKE